MLESSRHEQPQVVLAFDFGLRHVGVAVAQSVTGTATALCTLSARRGRLPRHLLEPLLREWRPNQLVVGLPLNMDGSESAMSEAARGFARRLSATLALPVALVDERLTSRAAVDQGADPHSAHAHAAALIAEDYFSRR